MRMIAKMLKSPSVRKPQISKAILGNFLLILCRFTNGALVRVLDEQATI